MIEYLFLDIEWNAKNNSKNISDWEPVQVAAIGADADLKAEKSFAKRVGLKDIETLTENTCKLTHVQRKEVAVAKPAKEVFGNLKQTFPKFSFVVVWSWETYQIYRETMKREEIQLPKHRVILMQEILQTIAVEEKNPIGFEAALRQAKVSYRPWMLHYSKYDVSYLYELFKSMYIKYDGWTRDDLCAVNPITRKIHQSDCRYAAGKNAVEMQGAKKFVFRLLIITLRKSVRRLAFPVISLRIWFPSPPQPVIGGFIWMMTMCGMSCMQTFASIVRPLPSVVV